MPQYKVKHQGQIKVVDYDGNKPTKEELRAALEMRPTLDYNLPSPDKIPNPSRYEKKDWLDKIDPNARRPERADRNIFTVDLSRVTNRAVDRAAMNSDDAAENKWKAQKLGFASGAAESALNMLGQSESVLTAAPRMFRQRYADYPGHSINPNTSPDLVPVGAEEAYNSSFPKPAIKRAEELGYEAVMRNQGRSATEYLIKDETGAIGDLKKLKGLSQGRYKDRGPARYEYRNKLKPEEANIQADVDRGLDWHNAVVDKLEGKGPKGPLYGQRLGAVALDDSLIRRRALEHTLEKLPEDLPLGTKRGKALYNKKQAIIDEINQLVEKETSDLTPIRPSAARGENAPSFKKGHISGRFLKKGEPYEADSFDVESSKPYVPPEPIDYVKQMLDSLKLADEQKKLAGLSPKKRR